MAIFKKTESNIWAGLDNVPTWADWVELKVYLTIQGNNEQITGAVYGIANGETESTAYKNALGYWTTYCHTSTLHSTIFVTKVSVDSDNIFKAYWVCDGTAESITFAVTGYGQNAT